MNVLTSVTRQSKMIFEHWQEGADTRNIVKVRRLMYKREDWQAYKLQVLKLLSLELEVSNAVLDVACEAMKFSREVYEQS